MESQHVSVSSSGTSSVSFGVWSLLMKYSETVIFLEEMLVCHDQWGVGVRQSGRLVSPMYCLLQRVSLPYK